MCLYIPMMHFSEFFRPRVGHAVLCKSSGDIIGVVSRVEDSICYYNTSDGSEDCYIWRFCKLVKKDGWVKEVDELNKLKYTWPMDGLGTLLDMKWR